MVRPLLDWRWKSLRNIYDLQDISFVDVDVEKLENEFLADLEYQLGKKLYPSSPERILALSLFYWIIQERININETAKANLLLYGKGEGLEQLGALVGERRLGSSKAMTTFKFTLSTELNFVHNIPEGTLITADGLVNFEIVEDIQVPIGQKEIEVVGYCALDGEVGNDFLPGQINKMVTPIPYLQSVENITESYGGVDVESDDQYRQAIYEAPEKFSTAGPDGAYLYWAKRANGLVGDVSVGSPSPGVVRIYVLLKDGKMPTEEIIQDIYDICNDREVRPLTDKLEIEAPNKIEYELNLEYYIDSDSKPFVSQIQGNISDSIEEYVNWQSEKIGRDINPDKIVELMRQAGAKRVVINNPIFTKISRSDGEIAVLTSKEITFKGVEDD